MNMASCLIGSTGECVPSLDYLEGLEDGVLWARAKIMGRLRGLLLEEKDLEEIRQEISSFVEVLQLEKTLTLETLLEDQD